MTRSLIQKALLYSSAQQVDGQVQVYGCILVSTVESFRLKADPITL